MPAMLKWQQFKDSKNKTIKPKISKYHLVDVLDNKKMSRFRQV